MICLSVFNCVVETAHDGGEAMRMVRSLEGPHYDVVLSEIRLPDMTGHDLFPATKGSDGSRADGADDRVLVTILAIRL